MRRIAIAIVAATVAVLAVIFGGVTLFALEGGSVAVLHSKGPDGKERRTHVWFAEDDGALWVEAATESRPFFTDIQSQPVVSVEIRERPFDRPSRVLRGRAERVAEPGGHDRIRELLAAKYGWADKWIGLLTDTSASRAVRIPIPPKVRR